jgi:hypothetical protein
MGEARYWGGE